MGDEHGVYYVAMEYVPMSLGTILEHQDKLEWQQARIITRQVAAAPRAAARGGIPTHLDLKPQNVLLSKKGVVKVADFGAVGAAPRGQTLGSPQYLSPEQAQGEPLDVRSDMYSMGVVLHQMLTGVTPLHGMKPDEVRRVHESDVNIPLKALDAADVPKEAKEITRQLLSQRPEERFASAQDLIVRLAPK